MSTRAARAATPVAAEEPEPEKKKRGAAIFIWIVVLAIAAVAVRYLLQLRVDPNTQQVTSSDGSQTTASAPSSSAAPAAPSAPSLFNPRSLDASRSGRLRLGLDNFPASLVLSLQMDGAPYWNGSAGEVPRQIVIPAGRHDFRVVVNNIGGAISSTSAGAQFGVGKAYLISAQIRPEPAPSASVLPPSSRITLTVKPDPFAM
jgi:hypothetical protein